MKNKIYKSVGLVLAGLTGTDYWVSCAEAQGLAADPTLPLLQATIQQIGSGGRCGEPIRSLGIYEQVSMVGLIAAFGLILVGILIDKKMVKSILWGLAVVPLAAWGYVNFLVDFEKIRQDITNYNLQAEATLANIAEAQDRYKSEQDTFLKDLQELESHLSGAQGINPCVRILELNVSWNHWSAVAKHVSSPETVLWDSTSGSSLKKG